MNKVILTGRLCSDPEIFTTQGDKPTTIAKYRLAVDRRFKREGEQSADFISCVAFGKNGEFAQKYLKKGIKIGVVGKIQTGSYEKDGNTVYTTDVVIDEQEFCERKNAEAANPTATNPAATYIPNTYNTQPQFEEITDDDELPF